ncbi:cell surface protein [Pseudoflavitalea sp. X16]|uniref:PKD domain-containing protein n=1 Tax=Paraflavitalea devenefica TaxID=2716334 RepID=UPI00142233D2|nr:PKD domain-containing protein [Paraflavitalea devenefica]NII26314.1 cell surface protein [Paraflavitalea devenefica]
MNKIIIRYQPVLILLVFVALLPGCKKDTPDKIAATVMIKEPAGGFVVDRYQFLVLPATTTLPNAVYAWKAGNEIIATTDTLRFISHTAGTYPITLTVTNGTETLSTTINVVVKKESTAYSSKAMKVFEYFPAPGQFVNSMPEWKEGETAEQMALKATNALKTSSGIHLGGFGGFVVVGFDHAIMNNSGQASFKVLGNAFNEWSEAGIIEVAMDANGNGLPDDTWYEIAGSEYNSPKTIHHYEITYHKPDENKVPTPDENNWSLSDTTYIRWTDNQGAAGYLSKNVFHAQPYYPQWKGSSITFKGTKLTSSGVKDQSGNGSYYVSSPFSFGYADNWPNADEGVGIRLDWAVDKAGKPVKLPAIHFIRIYTGMRAEAGWLGEVSTEIMGVEDLGLQ